MGDSDLETMANVTRAVYDFNDESFEPISKNAKDFISKLLVKDKTYVLLLFLLNQIKSCFLLIINY